MKGVTHMAELERLHDFISEKPCPRCGELLHWSSAEPPRVKYDTRTGRVLYVVLTRFCIADGYTEVGYLNIGQDPIWTEKKESE
jgi:hypothetical protein